MDWILDWKKQNKRPALRWPPPCEACFRLCSHICNLDAFWTASDSHDMWTSSLLHGVTSHICGAAAVQNWKSLVHFLSTVGRFRCKFPAIAFYGNTSKSHMSSVLNTNSIRKKKTSVGTGPTHTRKIKAPHQMYRSSSFSKTAAEGLKQPIYSRVNWTQPPLRDQLNHQPKPWWKVKPYSHWNVLALSLAICGETNSGVLCVLLQAFI